ncbi:SH3 domain-containing protein, partial [Phocea massiliensis]
PSTPATKTGYSTGDRVRIRSLASTSSSILTHVNRGDSFTVHGESRNGWYAVTLKDGTKGYISADYVSFTAPSTPATKTGYSTGDRVRIRSLASTSSSILTHVN